MSDGPIGDHPFPKPDFDPISANPEELENYRPDKTRQPALHRAWLRLFEGRPEFIRPTLEPDREFKPSPGLINRALFQNTRIQTSRNWAGAMIVPHDSHQLVQVFGEWVVPRPDLPPVEDRGPVGQKNLYRCSTWIGIDGDRRYLNSSLPQIGTEQWLTVDANGTATSSYRIFFQWWAAHQHQITYEAITNLAIKDGMSVTALLWAISPSTVVAVFRTFAPNQITLLVKTAPPVDLPNKKEIIPSISGATGEWMVERPKRLVLGSTKLERFPDYGKVPFTHCVAGTAPQPGLPIAEEVLDTPRYLRMFEVPTNRPSRTRRLSTPRRVNTTAFDVFYGAS
jgi:hypothetical protein